MEIKIEIGIYVIDVSDEKIISFLHEAYGGNNEYKTVQGF